MPEEITPLRKLSRAELLEMLVEQGKAVNRIVEEKEDLEKQLQKSREEAARLKKRIQKGNARIKALQEALSAEQRIRMQSLLESRSISEASMYMNQLLEDTRKANILYQKLILRLADEARRHEKNAK